MRKFVFGLIALGLCSVFLFGYFFILPGASAQKVARLQWEYATIRAIYSLSPARDRLNKIYGIADICYVQATGCKRAEIKHEFDYGEFLIERGLVENYDSRSLAGKSASEIALQKALAQLGSEGWEIVSEPDVKFEVVNVDDFNKFENKSLLFVRENTKAIYFKRPKLQ